MLRDKLGSASPQMGWDQTSNVMFEYFAERLVVCVCCVYVLCVCVLCVCAVCVCAVCMCCVCVCCVYVNAVCV